MPIKHTSKYNSWGLNGTEYWRFFILEYLHQINWRRSQISILYIKFLGFFSPQSYIQRIVGTLSSMRSRMSIIFKYIFSGEYHICNIYTYHISMYFLKKIIFHFLSKGKISYFPEKNTIFPDNTRKITFKYDFFFAKTIFSGHLKEISYFLIFFWETSSFISCLKNKIIFSGKRNIIFPNNTIRKIMF